MKAYAYLQIGFRPMDGGMDALVTNRPITEMQWKAVKTALHMGEPCDVVALPDETPIAFSAVLGYAKDGAASDEDIWNRIKQMMLKPEDVCDCCGSIKSWGELHDSSCNKIDDSLSSD